MSEPFDVAAQAAEVLRGILLRMGIEATVASRVDDGRVVLEIGGDDVAVAIGAKGRTLDALQFVVGRVVNRGSKEPVPVVVDGADYRARRAETLRDLALGLRERVLRTGVPAEVEDLNAAERKIVHAALAEAGGVTSHSEGEEPYRVLVIERASASQSTPSG